MMNEAEHHGIEPEPRARPCPSAIDGMLHTLHRRNGAVIPDPGHAVLFGPPPTRSTTTG